MSTAGNENFAQVWDVVSTWPEPLRAQLADKIIASIKRSSGANFGRPWRSIEDLVGLAATDSPPPTDEEVDRIIEDELSKRYLRD
jgi:hypothetical protein